ncbi:DNRLRE domain-containing protein [Niastella caeni]|uniref:DNRLRE domain-containing protein n=1 Tax=Niastella caeni TaxID=2569763 RepID=A0A4S8HXG3_9BACT|nr:DNRLRE domain-containing protein [Niastella caeni]THU39469.1 DNRLRE domain-containing protein [Niastella caeni]
MRKFNPLSLLSLLLAFSFNSQAQTPNCTYIKATPTGESYQEALISTATPNAADQSRMELVAAAWTCVAQEKELCDFRSLLRFDVSSIPANTVITGAKLYLYAKTDNINGNKGRPTYGTNNTAFLQRITTSWKPASVSWNAQPAVATSNQKILPQSASTIQNYEIDVTDFVQSWINKPDSNFGMLLRLQVEKHYNSLVFNSGKAPAALRPRLEICFPAAAKPVAEDTTTVSEPAPPPAVAPRPVMKESKILIIRGDKTSGQFKQLFLNSNVPYKADSTHPELGAAAWTCDGIGYPTCNVRSLFRYEVKEVPANANIISAKLFLYAKTNNINGIKGQPTYGENNKALLQRVTTPWKMAGTGWENQPRVAPERQKLLPQSKSKTQSYAIDITDFVRYWVKNPAQNHGMLLRLQVEEYYNSMIFYSSQAPNDALKPRLEIRYEIEKR